MPSWKKKIILLTITNLVVVVFAIILGSETINPFAENLDPVYYDIIFKLRLPRIVAGMFAGMTLAASGLIIQVSLNNQLADASILGFQSGATLVAMIVMLALPSLYPIMPIIAFCGGMVVFLIIYSISLRNQGALFLIIGGIAVGAVIRSLISIVTLLFADNLQNTLSWTNGSLTTVNITDAKLIAIYSIILLIIALVLSLRLDFLLLDDQFILNLGKNPRKLRFMYATIGILLSSVSISFVGSIGFVGLLGPHISRKLVGENSAHLMPITILVGSLLVLGCDTLQRIIFPIYEVPVGTALSFIGGIYLIILILRRSNVRV